MVSKANGLTQAIINFVDWQGGIGNRISSAGRMIKAGKDMKYIPGQTKKGSADVTIQAPNGKFAHLEIKVNDDKPREEQLIMQSRVRAANGVYEFVGTMDQFYVIWDSLVEKPEPITEPGQCCYCETRFIFSTGRSTSEHLVPVSKGGNNSKENQRPCCSDCNNWRSNKSFEYWKAEILELLNNNRTKVPYNRYRLELMAENIGKWEQYVKENLHLLARTMSTR